MNPCRPRLLAKPLLCLGLLTASLAPLPAATLYWDTNGDTAGTGGIGTWSNLSGNWSTDTAGTLVTTWTSANRDTADFRGTAGTVTVDSGIAAGQLLFNVGGYTLSGADLTVGRASGATTPYTIVSYAAGSGATTISSNIVVDDSLIAGAATYTINNATTGGLTLGGNLTLNYASGTPSGNKAFAFQTGSSSGVITLNGTIASGANGGGSSLLGLTFGQGGSSQANALTINGTFYVNGNNSGVGRGTTINGGTVIVGHNSALGTGTITFGSSGARGDMKLLTESALTITNAMSVSGAATSQTYIGGNSAHDTTYSGGINLNAFGSNGSPGTISTPNPILTAAAGGRVNFTGALAATASIPRGIVKKGAGIVALSNAAGNTYKGTTQIDEGTLLLMNTTGSATGDASQLTAGTVGVVVAGGAKLGGTGISTVLVGASAANSVFTPGDMTKEGVSSIGTLRLTGGLTASTGATFNHDLNGASVDAINFGTSNLTLGGTLTFNLTSLGTVQTGTPYTLFTGTAGTWSSVSSTFVFNSPTGYVLDTSYGAGAGYIFDEAGHSLTVALAAIPEPSTYAFFAGAGLLGFAVIRRKIRASRLS